jgi:hypothetical protein
MFDGLNVVSTEYTVVMRSSENGDPFIVKHDIYIATCPHFVCSLVYRMNDTSVLCKQLKALIRVGLSLGTAIEE